MKKILSLTLALVVLSLSVFALFSCGEDDGHYKKIGLSFYLTPGEFHESTYPDCDIAYTKIMRDENGNSQGIEAEFTVNAMSYQELEEATYNDMPDPWPTNVKDYIRNFVIVNGFSLKDYTYDEEKNIAQIKIDFEYPAEAGDRPDEYCHFVVMDNGEAIYFITYSCKQTLREKYEPIFDSWVSMLELDKVK